MGDETSRSSYNAPQLLFLGWAAVLATVSGASLPAGTLQYYTLPALTTADKRCGPMAGT